MNVKALHPGMLQHLQTMESGPRGPGMLHGVSHDLGKWVVGSILVAHQVPSDSA